MADFISADCRSRRQPMPAMIASGSTDKLDRGNGYAWPALSLGERGMVCCFSITTVSEFAKQSLAKHPSEARCSLSLRERVRARGKCFVADSECGKYDVIC